jgi:hypothetical protein
MKILMVLTSHDQLGNTGRETGFWLEEFAPRTLSSGTPFLVEDELKRIGGLYEKAAGWAPFAVAVES